MRSLFEEKKLSMRQYKDSSKKIIKGNILNEQSICMINHEIRMNTIQNYFLAYLCIPQQYMTIIMKVTQTKAIGSSERIRPTSQFLYLQNKNKHK